MAESLWLPEVLAHALISKGLVATFHRSRFTEALALTRQGLALALEHELPGAAFRAYNNLADLLNRRDRCEEAVAQLEPGLALTRRIGHRVWEETLLGELSWSFAFTGRWDDALGCLEQVAPERLAEGLGTFVAALPEVLVARGELDEARRLLAYFARWDTSADIQQRTGYRAAQAVMSRAEGREREALAAAEEVLGAIEELGPTAERVKVALVQALEAAFALGERARLHSLLELVEALPPGRIAPSMHAQAARFRARLAATDGDNARADKSFSVAAATFREFGAPFWLAVTLMEHGDWLVADDRAADAERQLAEAREIFERLEATPWLGRIEGAARAPATASEPI
jgi:tetratricopeptide (TPR) repeat protein